MIDTYTEINSEFKFPRMPKMPGSAFTDIQLGSYLNQVKNQFADFNANKKKYEGKSIDITFEVENVTETVIKGIFVLGGRNPTAVYNIEGSVNDLDYDLISIKKGGTLRVLGRLSDLNASLENRDYFKNLEFGYDYSCKIYYPRIILKLDLVKILVVPETKNDGCLGFLFIIVLFYLAFFY